jgi:hypothetical protein
MTTEEISYKQTKDTIKKAFKLLESNQRHQRKMMKEGDYTQKSQAQSTHYMNRYDLRHHYIAYHQFRKSKSTYSKILADVKEGTVVDQNYIDKLLSKYAK